jgi:UDP-2-acetamido-2-deoxy-ribo-hexuluronate aminotransferase
MIKMIDLAAEYQLLKKDLDYAIQQVLEKGNYIQGEEVKIFEKELGVYLKVKHVISCANGTDALQIALQALNIGNGDEVIIPAFSYISVIEVICLLGAKPVLVEVNPDTFQIDENEIEKLITSKTKAIIPVHLFGACGNLEAILSIAKAHQLFVIEDNAQALGATYQHQFLGSFGDIGCTSFFPTKNLACFGDGGALFTNDDLLAEQIRAIANHGQKGKYNHEVVGLNSRLDTLQAAILSIKLKLLDKNTEKRRAIADQYLENLATISQIELPTTLVDCNPSWNQFTIKIKNGKRDFLKAFLNNNGIETMIYYPKVLNNQKAYTNFGVLSKKAVNLCTEVLSLPIHPMLKAEELRCIIQQINTFFNAKS